MNRSNVEEIKARLPIEEVLASYIKLEKAGKSYKAKCPFHNEKSASFFVSPDRGGYYCFGCGAKGDIFSFVEQFEGLDFKGALKVLADRAGVTLTFDTKNDSEKDKLLAVTEEATAYFEAEYAKSAEAQAYVKRRGVTDKTRAAFRIGWAPEGWRNLHTHLKAKKYSDSIIVQAGLAKEAEDKPGNYYDRFRGRVMFPISDSGGRIIAFSGRILKEDDKSAKYLNSPDTPLFDKSSVLYGLDKAKTHIRKLDYSILVEGQMDLVMSHQAGVMNTVASSGTALAEASFNKEGIINNLGLLRRLSPNAIIAFDSDAAGRKAAMRAAGIGLSLEMNIKIADIEGGKDPAELVLANPDDWKNILRAAKQVVEFEFDNVRREITDNRKLRLALEQRVYPLLLNIPSRTNRDHFIKLIAEKAGITEMDIREDLVIIQKRIEKEAGTAASSSSASSKATSPSRTSAERPARIDLVQRRLFGLLDLMEKANAPKAAEYRTMVKKSAGGAYDQMIETIKPLMGDILFEAESFYGADSGRWDTHIAELLANFEADLVNTELIQAMNELRSAEKAGNQARVAELATKCQALSLRKSQISRNK